MPVRYKLDYQIIDKIRTQLNICSTFIDLFHIKNYKGKVHTSHGRTVIRSALFPQSQCYIIIDKDNSTRYFVERKVLFVDNQSENYDNEMKRQIISFEGYKMELNKYMIHGYFQMFEMRKLYAYFGFQEIRLTLDFQKDMKEMKGVERNEDKITLLFCKVEKEDKIIQHYFDGELSQIKTREIIEPSFETSQYFLQTISDNNLNKIKNNDFINTKVLNYFFSRLVFSYQSQFWYKGKEKPKIKALPSHGLNFFYKNKEFLIYEQFYNKLYYPYDLLGKNPLDEQKLIILPIYDGNQHFVLGAIRVEGTRIELYELDPMQYTKGVWRDRLGLIIDHSIQILKQKQVSIPEYSIEVFRSLDCINAPRQQGGSNCGIFICIYSLLLMHKLDLISLSEQFLEMCKTKQKTAQLSNFMRKLIFRSYVHRNLHILSSLQTKSFQFNLKAF